MMGSKNNITVSFMSINGQILKRSWNCLAMSHNIIDSGFQVKPALVQNNLLQCQNMMK